MPGLDERLTKDLARLSPAVEPAPDVMRRLDHRRRKRHLTRVVGTALLTITVVAGSVGGFVALRRAFREGPQPAITPTPAPGPDTSASLDGEWEVINYDDGTGTLVEPAVGRSTLNFTAGGAYGVDIECNLLGGRFSARGRTITFSEVARHDSRCSADELAAEEVFIQAVTTSTTFEIRGEALTLFDTGGEPAVALVKGEQLPGQYLGLPNRLCSVERLGGVTFGEAEGAVWVGTRVRKGRCPDSFSGGIIVAADLDGDGAADTKTAITCRGGCDPSLVGSVDVNADGSDEIFVTLNISSTPHYQILTLVPSLERGELVPVTVGAVGHPEAGFRPGRVAVFMTGGDEGFAGRLHCQDWPSDTVLSYVWTWHAVDSSSPTQALHRTRFALGLDGVLALVERLDQVIPIDQQVRAFLTTSRCGDLDLDPFS